jgi:uncharacterized phage protein gp47/JayE
MSDYGVTDAGFVLKRFENIKSDLQAGYISLYGNPNLADTSVIGQRIALESNMLAQAWEGLQLAYNAPFPSLCGEGDIDNVMALSGLTRNPATPTVLTCDCVFSAAGTIPTGALIANEAGSIFAAVADIVATGAETVQGNFSCTENGPVPMPTTGTLSIQTPASGWSSVGLHEVDGEVVEESVSVGSDIETLAEARVRRLNSLMATGSATLDAIRSAILDNVSTVSACQVTENPLPVYVGNTLEQPPHSIHVICQSEDQGTAEQLAIAQQIWYKRAAGIAMQGDTEVSVDDSQGNPHTVKFDYASEVEIDFSITYSINTESPYDPPDDIEAAITAALNTLFSSFVMGEDIIWGRVLGACYSVPGIIINTMTMDGDTANISIADADLAVVGTVVFP